MKYSKDKPIYLQLMNELKINIINGNYSSGAKIDSIREFAEKMMVNPNTVQRAYRELENLGFIESRMGMGYYVNDDENIIYNLKKEYLNNEIDDFIDKMSQLKFDKKEIVEIIKEKL